MIHNDEIYYIPTYMVNPKVKEYTYNLIKYLKSQDKEIILVSHYPIPIEFQELVDYCIYDKRNVLLYEDEYKGHLSQENEVFTIFSQEFFSYNSTIACYYFYSALFLAKFLGKRIVHSIDYDTIVDNTQRWFAVKDTIAKIKNQDMHSWYLKCIPDLIHNQQLYTQRTKPTLDRLIDCLSYKP
jgi:hypothetical protein